jgi:hypothetical protein
MLVKFTCPPRPGIVRPCNGLARCPRHPSGCATIVQAARTTYAQRQQYKTRRRHLWQIVRDHYRIAAKWGLNPPPPSHHLTIVLLMEQAATEALAAVAYRVPVGDSSLDTLPGLA